MKTDIKCIGCFVNQMISAVNRIDTGLDEKRSIVSVMLKYISQIDFSLPAPVAAKYMYSEFSKITGISDPFKEIKNRSNKLGELIVKDIDVILSGLDENEKFISAVKYLISANIIDYGAHADLTEEYIINEMKALNEKYIDLCKVDEFKKDIENSKQILYIGDNAGEIMVDAYFIRTFLQNKNVTFCTRGIPVINDITEEDAYSAGIQNSAHIINSADATPGIDITVMPDALQRSFAEADMIIAKGQGNFETLGEPSIKTRISALYNIEVKAPLYCLFKAKCPHVSEYIQKPLGSMVIISF